MTRFHTPPPPTFELTDPGQISDDEAVAIHAWAYSDAPRPVGPVQSQPAEVIDLAHVRAPDLFVGDLEGPPKAGWLFTLAAYVLGFTIATVVAVQVGMRLGMVAP